MKYLYAILIILSPYLFFVHGQDQTPLYQFGDIVPQSNLLNPAFIPRYKLIVGIPVLSSSHISVNAGNFSIDDLFEKGSNGLYVDTTRILNNLRYSNKFEINGDLAWLYLGLVKGNHYFSVSVNSKVNAYFTYPGDLIELLLRGNGDYRNINRSYDLNPLGFNGLSYHELGLGYAFKVNNKLHLGGRLKLIKGISALNLDDIEGILYTGEDSIYIKTSGFGLNTAGITNTNSLSEVAFGGKHPGSALDLGATYQVNPKMMATLSVIDMGFINWKENTTTYAFDPVEYSYQGFDLFDFFEEGSVDDDQISKESDSLRNLFKPEEISGKAFTTWLAIRTYAGVNYQFNKLHTGGITVYSDYRRGLISPALSLSYRLNIKDILNFVVNMAYKNHSINNIGTGMSFNLGPVQLYFITENIIGPFYPARAKQLDYRFGLNIAFRRKGPSVQEQKKGPKIKELE